MMKEDRDYELRQEEIEQEYREKHSSEYLVKFSGALYIKALNPEEAIEFAKDRDDLYDWVDDWGCEP